MPKVLYLLLYIIVVLCYHPIFSNGFLDAWDDQWMVINIYTETGWSPENMITIFTQSYNGQYSPLVELNYIFIYSLFGYNPFWFHLISVVWHCVCVTLVFFFVRRLLLLLNQTDYKVSTLVAYLTAFLFAIHPVNVESVAWISAVKVLMYVFFYLSALLLYLSYIDSQKIIYYITSILCFICSGLSKEQAFIYPVVLLLIDWFIRRDLRSTKIWLEKLPFLIISLGFAFLTMELQGPKSNAVSYTIGQRFLFGCYSLFEYLTKSVIPINLNYLYPFPIPEGSEDIPIRFYVYPVLVAVLVYVLFYFQKNRVLLLGSLFFILHLLLSLHIVQMPRQAIVADRYLYLSLIGILLLISYGIIFLSINIKNGIIKILFGILLLAYSGYLGIYTYQYSKKWESTNTVKEYLHGFENNNKIE